MPSKMPAFGFSAVPSPAKTRKMLPGCHPPAVAAAPNSRRDAAATVHANGPTTGGSPSEPVCNHDTTAALTTVAEPVARTAVTGAADRASAAGDVSTATEDPAEITGTATSAAGISGVTPDWRSDCTAGVRCRVVASGSESCPRDPVDEPVRSAAESARGAAPRSARRDGTRALVDVDAAPDPDSAALDPVDPAEPVVSAAANGIAATAEPTPRATASAPTRPTYRAKPAAAGSEPCTERKRYSIVRIRPAAARRS